MNSLIRFFTLRFDRTFSGHGRTQFAWLAGVLLLFFGFIYLISWFFSFPEPTDTPSSNSGTEVPMGRLLQLICLFIDPGSVANVPAELRWFSLIVAIMGLLLFTGLLISVVSNMLERHVERYREGNISYPLEKHVVIIGFDEMVPMLVLQICTDPQYEDCYILIQSVQPALKYETASIPCSTLSRRNVYWFCTHNETLRRNWKSSIRPVPAKFS